MPEGPELYLSCRFVNDTCKDTLFSGRVVKSVVTKNPEVDWDVNLYKISATSRGKEMKLTLLEVANENITSGDRSDKITAQRHLDISFRFGMSGKFRFDHVSNLHKHAHLKFFTKEGDMVLTFADQRRFGKWTPGGCWGSDRGPCVLFEYHEFRKNVLDNLGSSAFNKPICEALLNQKYFNGIGNYLRAEILYRAAVPPFVSARSVLEPLRDSRVKTEKPDILQLCNRLPLEVINLSESAGYDPEANEEDEDTFDRWLRCYDNPDVHHMPDHNKRTIWFDGPTGPLVPKVNKSASKKKKLKVEAEFSSEVNKSSSRKTKAKSETELNDEVTKSSSRKRKIKLKGELNTEEKKTTLRNKKVKVKAECISVENKSASRKKKMKQAAEMDIEEIKPTARKNKVKVEAELDNEENVSKSRKKKVKNETDLKQEPCDTEDIKETHFNISISKRKRKPGIKIGMEYIKKGNKEESIEKKTRMTRQKRKQKP